MSPRHFLDLDRLPPETLRHLLDDAHRCKREGLGQTLRGKTLAMIFAKPSTRTRVSFEVAMTRLGGHTIMLAPGDMQLGRGETVADTARVLSRYVDGILLRTSDASELYALAEHASVPVINGLTDRSHPCQILADLMTIEQRHGRLAGVQVAWVGDFNNVTTSFLHAAAAFGFVLSIATPPEMAPDPGVIAAAEAQGVKVAVAHDPKAAVRGAAVVVTDTWVSMNNSDADRRMRILAPYQVDEALMAEAAADAIFLHCLPAHRGEEVTAGVIDGPRSAVWDEAENRVYAQQAILAWALGGD